MTKSQGSKQKEMTFNWNGVTSETAAFNEYDNIFNAVIVGIGQLIKSIIK